MRGKNGICKLTDRKIKQVKEMLKSWVPLQGGLNRGEISLRVIAQRTGLSYKSVWLIRKGIYDVNEPLKPGVRNDQRYFDYTEHDDWIVGGKINRND